MNAPEPVVDRSHLDELVADVGPDATAGMIDHFLAMLDARLARLRAAPEADELHVAVLSLACSAAMLGADSLASVARGLSEEPGDPGASDHADSLDTALDRLEQLARSTAAALAQQRPALAH